MTWSDTCRLGDVIEGSNESASPLAVRLLGTPSILVNGVWTSNFRWSKVPRLLGVLSTRNGIWHRESVAATLWPDLMPAEGRHNLRQTILYARQLLGESAIIGDKQSIELSPGIDVDIHHVLRALDSIQSPEELLRSAERAVAAYQGEFLAGIEDEWVLGIRSQCEQSYLDALLLLSDHLLTADPRRALDLAARAVETEPFSDGARARKIRALLRLGEDAAAHREFASYRDLLALELCIEPSETVAKLLTTQTPSALGSRGSREAQNDEEVDLLLSGSRPLEGLALAIERVPIWVGRGKAAQGVATITRALSANQSRSADLRFRRGQVARAELLAADSNLYEARNALIEVLPDLADPSTRAKALILLAKIYAAAYQARAAQEWILQALDLSMRSNLQDEKIDAYRCAAEIAFQLEDLAAAEAYADNCAALSIEVGDWNTLANALSLLSLVRFRSGNVSGALEAGQRALDELANKTTARGPVYVRIRVCRLMEEMGDLPNAEEGYRIGIEAARRLGDTFGLAVALTYLGDLLTSKGDFEGAEEFHLEALEIRRRTQEKLGLATSLRGLGRIHLAKNRLDAAREVLRESERLFLESETVAGQVSSLLELARVSQRTGELEMALRIATRAAHLLRGMSRLALLTNGPTGDSVIREVDDLIRSLKAILRTSSTQTTSGKGRK